ncbi:MAG TPA: cyclic nucleotide-binding domain-containing protein [Candidatus Ozemobacteraceae bacterium]|nr:cyclic nucleotide-binding domain-containing protein [Candidatus Ozemobacteraceae bacterium]
MYALKGFSDSDFDILRRYLTHREAAKNEVIIKMDSPADRLFIVETGAVKIVQRPTIDSADDVTLGVIKDGGFFGEEALLRENQIYMSTAVAVEHSLLLVMNREGLQKLMVESISVGTKLLLALSRTYREALSTPDIMGKVITFYAPKGGMGCTTLAVNTAVLLARTGKRVVFLDWDMQFGNASLFVGAPAALNVGRLIQKEERLVYDRIKGFMTRRHEIDFLFCPELPQEAEIISRTALNQILLVLGKQYDYVVIDTRAEIDDQTLLAWDMADLIVLATLGDIAGITRMHRLFRVMSRLNYHRDKFAVLVNKYREGQQAFLDEFRKLSVGYVDTVAFDLAGVPEAELAGLPLVERSPDSPAGADIARFVSQLTGDEHVAKSRKGGIFSRLKSLFT